MEMDNFLRIKDMSRLLGTHGHPLTDDLISDTTFWLKDNLVSWKSKKLDVVVKSNVEADVVF